MSRTSASQHNRAEALIRPDFVQSSRLAALAGLRPGPMDDQRLQMREKAGLRITGKFVSLATTFCVLSTALFPAKSRWKISV
jgi:hypothetical protein